MTLWLGTFVGQLAQDTASEEFILQDSMQKQLDDVCTYLGIPPAVYTLHEVKAINHVEHRRYHASVGSGALGTPAVSIGRFGKDDYDAKEDVAAILLQRLLHATGANIRDYNHYNVQALEVQLKKTMDENLELEMELGMLNEEMRLLTTRESSQ